MNILPDRRYLTPEQIREWATGSPKPSAETSNVNDLSSEGDGVGCNVVHVDKESASR